MNADSHPLPWLDIIPPVPLVRGVPVITVANACPAVVVAVVQGGYILADKHSKDAADEPGSGRGFRVDLAEQQGFAYGVRLLWCAEEHPAQACFDRLWQAWLAGPTDADRLLLAEALRAVFAAG